MKFLRLKNALIALFLVSLLGITVYAQRAAILRQAGEFLIATDPLAKADIIYLLNGDHRIRPSRAAQLFHAGLAPKIVIPWIEGLQVEPQGFSNESDLNRAALRMCGVPDAQIVEFHFAGGVKSTYDEARALLSYAQLHGVRKAIVVTSDWHSRRARWTMRRLLWPNRIEVMVTAVEDTHFRGLGWTRRNEYLKLCYYWLRYQFSPIPKSTSISTPGFLLRVFSF